MHRIDWLFALVLLCLLAGGCRKQAAPVAPPPVQLPGPGAPVRVPPEVAAEPERNEGQLLDEESMSAGEADGDRAPGLDRSIEVPEMPEAPGF